MPIEPPDMPSQDTTVTLLRSVIEQHTGAVIARLAGDGVAVITNAVPAPARQALRDDMHAMSLRPAGIGRAAAAQQDSTVRSDSIAWMDGSTIAQRAWLEAMEYLRGTINRELFLGLFDYESHYARYEAGQFYRRHRDAFTGSDIAHSRVLSTVCYLNDDWQPHDAGELLLFDDNNDLLQCIAPTPGTLVIFLSEQFPHEVLPTIASRISIAGWFRRS